MTKKLPFTKMEGTGNDYIYINGFEVQVDDPAALAVRMSDRHFGVGSDGIVLILPSAVADLRMRMFNADGTEAEMCGNASRCVARYAHDHGLVKKEIIQLETGAGIRIIRLLFEEGTVCGATVDMGQPVLDPAFIPVEMDNCSDSRCVGVPLEVGGQTYEITAVSMGNPHAVVFMNGIDELDLPKLGPQFEKHQAFPKRINTECVEVLSTSCIRMRVWERGAGETLACGTGACAAVVACVLNGLTGREVEVRLTGGVLHVKWDEVTGSVYMSGPAVTVFTGEFFLEAHDEHVCPD